MSSIAFGHATATRQDIESATRLVNCEFVWGIPKGFDTEIGQHSLRGGTSTPSDRTRAPQTPCDPGAGRSYEGAGRIERTPCRRRDRHDFDTEADVRHHGTSVYLHVEGR